MEFIIIRALAILFLSISVQKINANMEVLKYETAELEGPYANTDPPAPILGLQILPNHFQDVCTVGGRNLNNIAASPIDSRGFGMYKFKLVGAVPEPSFNVLPCRTTRGILYMKRIADGLGDDCFVAHVHSPPLGKGGTYLRDKKGSSSQSC